MRKTHNQLITLLLPLFVLVLVVLGCSAPQGGTDSATAKTAADTSRPKENGVPLYKPEEEVAVGVFGYKVFGSWYTNRLSNNQFLNEPPDAKYLFVDLGVVNGAKESYTVPPFSLIDTTGAEYETSSKAWAAEGSIGLLDSLNPGVGKRAYVIFDVPEGRQYRLKVSGGYWSGDSALIELAPESKKPKKK